MFKMAIKNSLNYTRPLITGHLYYKDFKIINGISTMIILNKNADILTTGHIADLFLMADETNESFIPILKELDECNLRGKRKLLLKYGIKDDTLIGLANILIDIVENPGRLNIIKHPYLDMAIIRPENKKVLTKSFPVFNSNVEIGTSICKIGFAFPEYKTFEYSNEEHKIICNNEFMNFPIFPLDGMITRNVIDQNNELNMFETSTPILPGQAGGPVVNKDGEVLGIMIGNKNIISTDEKNPFNISIGMAISSVAITKFLKDNNIDFEEKK